MRLSSDDIGLWRRAMRDVVPLRGRAMAARTRSRRPLDRGRPARVGAEAGKMPAVRRNP